uniref:hypothetical protein n=1 Tax=Actinokineospora sp. CA-119265 TaxID=3239890 RepID=UPI003F497590
MEAVVCGPCWAAHGGSPSAGEIGAAPTETVPSWDPRDQRHWLSALRRQEWVQEVRVDGRGHVLAVARVLALHADWDTLETRPTWAVLCRRTRLSETTVARWLQELRVRGWLAHIERGSTPATRPGPLAAREGNRAAVYGLRIPLSPVEAVARAAAHAAHELERRLAQVAAAQAEGERLAAELAAREQARAEAARLAAERAPVIAHARELIDDGVRWSTADPDRARDLVRAAHEVMAAHAITAADLYPTATYTPVEQAKPDVSGDKKGTPSWSFQLAGKTSQGGYARASGAVDNSEPIAAEPGVGKDHTAALRARFDQAQAPVDWAVRVPVGRFQMLCAADWLRREARVFARLTRKAVRAVCRSYWAAGWCNREILHAMDHRPSVFEQAAGVPIRRAFGDHVDRHSALAFIGTRLRAWQDNRGRVLPGNRRSQVVRAAATAAATARHGRAGAALLRQGETALTAARVADHGRRMSPLSDIHLGPVTQPAVPVADVAVRAAATALLDQALADQHRRRADQAARAELHARFGDQLAAARAELAARTTPDVDVDTPTDDVELSEQQRWERARAAATGYRRANRRPGPGRRRR